METRDLENIWKGSIEKEIQSFSQEELNNMLLSEAKKGLKKFYSIKSNSIILGIVILFLIIITVGRLDDTYLLINNLFILLSAITGLTLNLYSYSKIMNYDAGQPIKEWLKYRIDVLSNATKRFNAYYFTFPLFVVLCNIAVLSFWDDLSFIEVVSSSAFPSKMVSYVIASIVAAYFLKRYMQKYYKDAIENLQKVYDEIAKKESELS